MSGLIGKKIGMAQIFQENGTMVPVTYLLCEPNTIHHVKTVQKDGIDALVLGGEKLKKEKKTKKYKIVREFSGATEMKKGDEIKVDIFENDEEITVIATSKGKGFTGNVKRHNFKDLRQSHGTKFGRHGSTSSGRNRPKKGCKMPGRSGNQKITLRNCKIVAVDLARNLISLLGPIPGAKNAFVLLKKQG